MLIKYAISNQTDLKLSGISKTFVKIIYSLHNNLLNLSVCFFSLKLLIKVIVNRINFVIPINVSKYIYIYLLIHQFIYLLFNYYLSFYFYVYLSFYPSIYLSLCLSIFLSIYLSIYLE